MAAYELTDEQAQMVVAGLVLATLDNQAWRDRSRHAALRGNKLLFKAFGASQDRAQRNLDLIAEAVASFPRFMREQYESELALRSKLARLGGQR